MGLYLDTYNDMVKAAADAQEKVAEPTPVEKTAEEKLLDERMEVLSKYAEVADNALAAEYGNDYTEDDVVKLAQKMIDADIQEQDMQEKVAEAYELGVIIGKGIKAELTNEGN